MIWHKRWLWGGIWCILNESSGFSLTMRKIEQAMIDAIRSKQDWRNDNTRVEVIESGIQFHPSFNRIINVYLHGNKIASIDHVAGRMTLNSCGWMSNTTKSRLNALCHSFSNTGIHQSDHIWYIGKEEFEDGVTIPASV